MESFGTPSPIPRLRLTRQSPKFDDGDTPQAGPSRFSPYGHRIITDIDGHENHDEADDAQSTPKMPTLRSMSPEPTSAQTTIPQTDTPAARLRALLSRVPNSPPNSGASPHVAIPSSEPDSDFDPPRTSLTNTPSIARESLKDLFSRALRDPGDTPEKNKRRRNSIDVSEVESSPRVERERAKNKGKRRSLSDEEADKPSRSGTSLRSSQATTFDTLRARLTSFQTQLMDQHAPFDDYANNNEPFLQQLEHSPASPPAATSTPPRSLQSPSQLQFQSNLLEQDLHMQKAMDNFDSFEEDSGPSKRPASFPPARTPQAPHFAPARPLSQASGSKVHSASGMHGVKPSSLSRHGSTDLVDSSSPRTSSSQSDFHQRDYERERELNREREREWNKPQPHPKTPKAYHRHSHSRESNSSGGRSASPMLNLTNGLGRRSSMTSLKSLDDGRSSRTSSFGSQVEYRERINELEKERNEEREREWNKRHPATSRPTSSHSMHPNSSHNPGRTRTQSHPTRPDAAIFPHSPDHLHRYHSFNSGRSSSPSSSVRSRDSEKELELEVKHETEHVRERNWNAPHPKWNPNAPHHHRRSMSPLPPSLSPRPSISYIHTPPHSHGLRAGSPRVESPTHHSLAGKTTLRSSSSHSSLNNEDKAAPRIPSPLPHSATSKGKQPVIRRHPTDHAPQTKSPLLATGNADTDTKKAEDGSASKASASSSRFGWQFPRNKNPLPPLEFDSERVRNPAHSMTSSSPSHISGSRPTSKASGSVKASHIPVRSPQVSEHTVGSSSGLKKGHKRSTTELNQSAGGIPPRFGPGPAPFTKDFAHQDSVLASDEEPSSSPSISTPIMRPIPPVDDPAESSPRAPRNSDEARLQKALARHSSFDRSSPTPWPPPPPPESSLILATPPRRQLSSSQKVEFETPPPPKNLPELPGSPPSEDEGEAETNWTPAGLGSRPHLEVSTMKTPKPPGAWSSTPPLSRHDPFVRAHTLPDSNGFGESTSDSGLVTPIASFSRASSLPAQTPVAPGGWLATPGTERRKSVLKVRFDVESEQSASDAPANGHAHEDGSQTENLGESSAEASTPREYMPGLAEVKMEEVESLVTPRSTPPPSIRKSPSIRVVDAFGREQTSLNEDDISQDSTIALPVPDTPRSKGSVRIVDAMGREVEGLETNSIDENGRDILGHNEALRRVRQSIADLASGLSEVDGSDNELLFDDKRLSELNGVSQTARDARCKLSQTLRMARDAEDDIRGKYGSLRASMRKSKLLPAIIPDPRAPWTQNNALIFWGVVFVQVVLIVIMYRVSASRAKDIFLNTYYDPYYPELHLYVTKPDTFRLSMSHASHWSIFSVPDTFQRSGWKAAASEVWNGLAMVVWDWQMQVWDTWGTDQTISWPPT